MMPPMPTASRAVHVAAPVPHTCPQPLPVDPRAWSNDPAEVDRVEAMLVRANILPTKEARQDYRSAPWHWTKERASCDVLEGVMRQAHVLPEHGWEMTMLELLEKRMEEES